MFIGSASWCLPSISTIIIVIQRLQKMNLEFAAEVDKIRIVGTLLDLYQKFIVLHKIIAILSPGIIY